ncbi:metal-dependent hydrolase [Flavobacterium sp. MFBS3-15]|uniref:metal-dependent hydrolase n=1 Tax=Flavobacterium sp. MFBS3-15 TaxID=2989816 RepID=UPI002236843C|nr:metal-dependent hydrolase [Flavobacterium sp. MFBS3-15]MCW4468271.1 metal-dependent hydrolase [Flavobacterium sp. MFBS3-15]
MDSLTQIALGIATAELYAGDKLGRRTFLYGAILGTLPDLDIVVGKFLDPVSGVAIHRGLSHSLFLFMAIAPLLGRIIARMEKGRISLSNASTLAFWCLLTHVLLDMFTSWGTQVFWPLPHRVAFKTIFVVDPLYTVPLLTCIIIAWRKKDFGLRKKYVLRGVYISSAYLALTCGIKLYAWQKFANALEQQNIAYSGLIVKPTAFNCILWNANVETEDAYLLGDYSLFDSRPITFKRYQKNIALAKDLARNRDFQTLQDVSEGWYIVTKNNGQYYFNDLRFGLLNDDPAHPQFAFSYVFKEENGILKAYEVPKEKRDGKKLLKGILERIGGN